MESVRDFHLATDLAIREKPILRDVMLRMRLIREEFRELNTAVYGSGDLIQTADALADMVYVICGAALTWGIDLDRVFREVHRSNMSKLPVTKDHGGKVLKGPNYSPPDLSFLEQTHGIEPNTVESPGTVQS